MYYKYVSSCQHKGKQKTHLLNTAHMYTLYVKAHLRGAPQVFLAWHKSASRDMKLYKSTRALKMYGRQNGACTQYGFPVAATNGNQRSRTKTLKRSADTFGD